ETEQEWQESFAFIKTIGFGHIHIFTYSSREGTKAATLPNQVANEIKKQRSKQLHELAETMKQQFVSENIDQEFDVLWEGQKKEVDDNQQLVFGYTPNYLRVACKISKKENIENKIIIAQLNSFTENQINCSLGTGVK
ncbi:MAG: tRNA (N(6)-L-threonylcarbamoyladenosine(37)-C(2))-methylthiotransferase MtaB, partial [Methylococcales bacterium]|nr:tRNA (N(6)-L-threonylcarbamoyladenosine(37)-C(2))-methylthiotransferase MtaB [Methylococcales bacterium]